MYRRNLPTQTSRSERWQRENDAPRLADRVPSVRTLRFELSETRDDHPIVGTRVVRHIIVARAAALFEFPCGDPKCIDGGHDVTGDVIGELLAKRLAFVGKSACRGYVGDHECGRSLAFQAAATYG
jgi:hypothetical protein